MLWISALERKHASATGTFKDHYYLRVSRHGNTWHLFLKVLVLALLQAYFALETDDWQYLFYGSLFYAPKTIEYNHTAALFQNNEIQLPAKERKIAFVHVGKAGGSTIKAALPRISCEKYLRPNNEIDQMELYRSCYNRTYRPGVDSDIEVHITPRPQLGLLKQYNSFLVVVRNPITRIISAFKYLHHNNTGSVFARGKHPLKTQFYNDCFFTLNDFWQAWDQDLNNNSNNKTHHQLSRCQKLGIAALQGSDRNSYHINIHFRANYKYYHDKSVKMYPANEVFTVRTESFWDDLKKLDKLLGGSGSFVGEGGVMNGYQSANNNNSSSSSSSGNHYHGGSARARRNICCIVWQDLIAYEVFLRSAANLQDWEKQESLQSLYDSCSVSSDEVKQYQSQPLQFVWETWYQDTCPNLGEYSLQCSCPSTETKNCKSTSKTCDESAL